MQIVKREYFFERSSLAMSDQNASPPEEPGQPASEGIKAAPGSRQPVSNGVSAGMSFTGVVVISAFVSVFSISVALVAYDHFVAKKFVSIDVKGYVEQQQELFMNGKINEDQLKQNYAALKTVVQNIPKNKVVLMGDAVLGGVEKIDIQGSVQK
jgi:hypothetical protein